MTSHVETPPPIQGTTPAEKAAGQKPRSSRRRLLVALVMIVAAGVGGSLWLRRDRAHQAAPGGHAAPAGSEHHPADPEGGIPRVEITHPKEGGLTRTSSQNATVHAFEEAALYAKVSGFLKVLSVDIGDRVRRGQVLAEIEDPELVKERDRAAAALEQSRAAVIQFEARVQTAEANLQAAAAAVHKARADVEQFTSARKYREKQLARYKGLRAQRAVPQQIVDEEEEHLAAAVAAEASARAEVDTAEAKLVSARAQLEQSRADLVQAKAKVEVATATRDRDQVLVDYTGIVSPYDGVITLRSFHRGAFIRSAEGGDEPPILNVARTDKMRVVTYIPDIDVPFTDLGDEARVVLDALPGQVFAGKVSRFAETEDSQSRTMRTEIDLPNPENKLREGMYGTATVILHRSTDLPTLPLSCLVDKPSPSEATVFVVRDGKVRRTPVKLGVDNGQRVEILSGLTPQDDVVMKPAEVSEGSPAVAFDPSAPEKPKTSA